MATQPAEGLQTKLVSRLILFVRQEGDSPKHPAILANPLQKRKDDMEAEASKPSSPY